MAKVGSGGGVRHLKGGHHVCQDVHYHAMSIEVDRSISSSSRDWRGSSAEHVLKYTDYSLQDCVFVLSRE